MREPVVEWCIEYAGSSLYLRSTQAVRNAVMAELQPFFEATKSSALPSLLQLELTAQASARATELAAASPGRTVDVDSSLYAHLASTGTRWDHDDDHLVRINATGSLFDASPARGRARLSNQTQQRLVLDGVRLIKGLYTQGVERAGGVQLHSSGVVVRGRGVLILGDTLQGKTTLLLELLSEFRVDQLSCDTVVVRDIGSRLPAWGWPSPFSVNPGALADHAELAAHFPAVLRGTMYGELWRQRRKSVLASQDVVNAFAVSLVPHVNDLGCIIIARFKPEEHTRLELLEDLPRFLSLLRPCCLGSRDPIYHAWHGCFSATDADIDCHIDAIARRILEAVPVYIMTWAPSATGLMKEIQILAGAHPYLARVLF